MANETPESDFSIECFQNYSAPEVFVQGLAGMVDQNDVEVLIRAQKLMLQRFEKTTEMLTNCNQLSVSRLRTATTEFKKHTQLLTEMKKDLDFIFKKIRAIKTKFSTQYPDAYKAAMATAAANKKPKTDEDPPKPPETKNDTKMVSTVSTETLKPIANEEKKIKKREPKKARDPADQTISQDDVLTVKPKRSSSSSETESASSGDDTSTDTG